MRILYVVLVVWDEVRRCVQDAVRRDLVFDSLDILRPYL